MPKWNEVPLDDVEIEPGAGRARPKFTLGGGPLSSSCRGARASGV